MAAGNMVLDKGFSSPTAVTKFRAVDLTGNTQEVAQVTSAGVPITGISQFGLTTAEVAKAKGVDCRIIGISEWEAGAAVAIGVEVMTDNVGRCVPATSGNRVVGRCVGYPAGGAGDRSSILLYQGGFVKA